MISVSALVYECLHKIIIELDSFARPFVTHFKNFPFHISFAVWCQLRSGNEALWPCKLEHYDVATKHHQFSAEDSKKSKSHIRKPILISSLMHCYDSYFFSLFSLGLFPGVHNSYLHLDLVHRFNVRPFAYRLDANTDFLLCISLAPNTKATHFVWSKYS